MNADERRSERTLVWLIDLEILVIPLVLAVLLALLVKREVGALGVIPTAVLMLLVVLVPLIVRAFDPGRRERWAMYLGINLLITAGMTIVVWSLRVAVLALVS